VDGSLMVIRSTTTTLWHFDAGSGRRPPHQGEVVVALALGRHCKSVLSLTGIIHQPHQGASLAAPCHSDTVDRRCPCSINVDRRRPPQQF
jgi:hypothetical protein